MNRTIAQHVNEQASQKNIPLNVAIEITYRCNQHCVFCFQKEYPPSSELTTQQWCTILDQLAACGTLYCTFTGGEPFCRTDLLDILSHAHTKGCAVSLISNGTLIDETTIGRLEDIHLLDIGISLLASTESFHDRLTGINGSFSKAIHSIHALVKAGIKVIVKHSVTQANFGEYKALNKIAADAGCLFECDTMTVPWTKGRVSPYTLTQEQMAAFLNDMRGGTVSQTTDTTTGWRLHCDAGRSVCGITPSGDVVPCIQLPVVFGNLRNDDFVSIWNSNEARKFRINENELSKECTDCILSTSCMRCHGIAFSETGDFRGYSPSLCRYAEALHSISRAQDTEGSRMQAY